MWMFGWGMALMMFFGWLLPLLAVGLIVWLLIGRGDRQGGRGATEDTALRTVRERYARGEISREEFQQLLDDLRND